MFENHFYHSTTRKIVSIFGTIFNDFSIIRKDGSGKVLSTSKVPIAYGPKDKFIARVEGQPDVSQSNIAVKLPRLAFEITGISYDSKIKLNRFGQIKRNDGFVYTYAPYDLSFQLNLLAKQKDDALQIMEQILPLFQPEYTVSYFPLEEMPDLKDDLPIILTGVTTTDEYEGSFVERRVINYQFDFTIHARYYGPVRTKKIITNAEINTSFSKDFDTLDSKMTFQGITNTDGSTTIQETYE